MLQEELSSFCAKKGGGPKFKSSRAHIYQMRKEKIILTVTIFIILIITSISFVMSDTPDKVYLNPYYVDILVFMAGLFLIIEAYVHINKKRFYMNVMRIAIGTAIVTIHILQFVFDFTRNYKF